MGVTTITSAMVVHRGERYEGQQVTQVEMVKKKSGSIWSVADFKGYWITGGKVVYGWSVSGEIPTLWATRVYEKGE